MKPDYSVRDAATIEDIREAIDALSEVDIYRLEKAAKICLTGTEYQNSQEIINEAIVRTLNAANGGEGRVWPINVPFMAYMIQTVKGLANDSRESSDQKMTEYIESMATESANSEDILGRFDHAHSDALSQSIEHEQTLERYKTAKEDADKIDAYFSRDSEVTWIIMGLKDGLRRRPTTLRRLSLGC